MAYTVTKTDLAEVLILEPKVIGDDRGFFFESFNQRDFQEATGLNVKFVQDNHSQSSQGVIRGMHNQIQRPQGKLVRVTHGAVFDVAVYLRVPHPALANDLACNCLQTTGASCGFHRALHMALWSLVSSQSLSTRPWASGTPSTSAACCGTA